jgi:hypothetical protein
VAKLQPEITPRVTPPHTGKFQPPGDAAASLGARAGGEEQRHPRPDQEANRHSGRYGTEGTRLTAHLSNGGVRLPHFTSVSHSGCLALGGKEIAVLAFGLQVPDPPYRTSGAADRETLALEATAV